VNDDPLDTVVEPYALWAIRDPDGATGPLSFAAPDTGGHDSPADAVARASVHPDITPFYARKVRVLNGAHIATVHLGLLAGLNTVGEVMGTGFTRRFLDGLIDREILPALAHDGIEGGRAFADDVIDRFSNPHLSHSLAEIEKGSAQKVAIRLAPTARAHAARTGEPAPLVTLALAGWAERTRRVLLGSPGADAVLGTAVDRALAGAAGEPSRFAEALFGTVDSAFGAGVEGGDVADTAARIAESGPESAIACALG
jgi:mannitol-1-phosphate/altronate dehydrogenase